MVLQTLSDGGNVAYHDYMKTVLTKEEIGSIFPQTASAEYIGDMFEFWLRMLELGFNFHQCSEAGGQNLKTVSLVSKSRSGYSQTHAVPQTP